MVVLTDFPPKPEIKTRLHTQQGHPVEITLRGESKCDVTRSFSDSHEKDEDPVCDQIVYNF